MRRLAAFAPFLLIAVSGQVSAQRFAVEDSDLPLMKMIHYFTPDNRPHDPDFEWTFNKTGFTVKKGSGPIPKHLLDKLLPNTGGKFDEITGKWRIGGRTLELTEIKAGGKATEKDVSITIFKTAALVVRICDPEQVVFQIKE